MIVDFYDMMIFETFVYGFQYFSQPIIAYFPKHIKSLTFRKKIDSTFRDVI